MYNLFSYLHFYSSSFVYNTGALTLVNYGFFLLQSTLDVNLEREYLRRCGQQSEHLATKNDVIYSRKKLNLKILTN